MDFLSRVHAFLTRRLAQRRAGDLAREAALVLQRRNKAPLASLERTTLTARAHELHSLAAAAAAEAVGDEEMVIEHRVEAAYFGKSARLHGMFGTPA